MNSGLQKYLSNTIWMVSGRMFKMFLGLLGTGIVARYLGPERFGLLNYCFSFVSIALVAVVMGLEAVVVRELVKFPNRRAEIMGSSLMVQCVGLLVAGILLTAFAYILKLDRESISLLVVGGISLIFRPLCIFRFYFEATVQANSIARLEFIYAFIGILLRIVLVYVNAPLVWFAFCLAMEWIVMGIGFTVLYFRQCKVDHSYLSFSTRAAKALLNYSWPLLVSSATIILHQQIDKVMLKELLGEIGNNQVGFYSAAVRFCIFVIFIPQMIAKSLTPALVSAFSRSQDEYRQRIALFMDVMNWTGIGLSLVLCVLAKPLIMFTYGETYVSSILILQIAAWKGFFSSTGMASGRQSTIENLQRYAYLRNLIGLVVNVFLNAYLIPRYQAVGAAYATVISMFAANILSHLIIKPYWHIFKDQLQSIMLGWYRLPKYAFEAVRGG